MYAIHYQAKSKSLKAFCLYRQMIGKAQELKSGGGFTKVRSRALPSCAICTEYTYSARSILNLLHLIQIVVSGSSCIIFPAIFTDTYHQYFYCQHGQLILRLRKANLSLIIYIDYAEHIDNSYRLIYNGTYKNNDL